jgi:hypothetical protein
MRYLRGDADRVQRLTIAEYATLYHRLSFHNVPRHILVAKLTTDDEYITITTNKEMANTYVRIQRSSNSIVCRLSHLNEEISDFSPPLFSPLPLSRCDDETLGKCLRELDTIMTANDAAFVSYQTHYDNQFERNVLLAKLESNRLQLRLHNRGFALDYNSLETLPEDMVGEIREFIGEEFLSHIRHRSIQTRYFPGRKDDIIASLMSWRMRELKMFATHLYLNFKISLDDNDIYTLCRTKGTNKRDFIQWIVDRRNQILFFPFVRDVAIITRALRTKRRSRKSPL